MRECSMLFSFFYVMVSTTHAFGFPLGIDLCTVCCENHASFCLSLAANAASVLPLSRNSCDRSYCEIYSRLKPHSNRMLSSTIISSEKTPVRPHTHSKASSETFTPDHIRVNLLWVILYSDRFCPASKSQRRK
ncbi:hypothetical protein BDB00DRAFT_829664 [Zychaea mexicana]|uniref:uncharacterized protein n=1 Tax=Zychaea mexicana TaxID=64656 RepID=UPI0022FDB8EF|nr:uncharacterized protein BDB00DRAFT_829664 [Zychaea mexicana]KAI9492206.1 hypothetical protein BDB00DRAFT_829664 [Zychaea mexicana]